MHGKADATATNQPQPLFIQGMFSWLHRPAPHWGGDTAVLLCPGLASDALDSHRFLRVLADDLAAAGYPTLRFDYPGTGDSAHVAPGTNLHTAWRIAVHAAADELLAATGATRLILCGLRFGAMLAAQVAAQREDVAGLALLAPVLRGQSYIRQLWVEAGVRQAETAKLAGGFPFKEHHFTPSAVAAFTAADLRSLHFPHPPQILICAQSANPVLTACQEAWAAQGAAVASTDFQPLQPLLTHHLEGETAPPDFTPLLSWMKNAAPPAPKFFPARPLLLSLQRAAGQETPIQFGANHLFGMLCRPATPTKHVVLLLSGGRTPHYGIGRAAVHLAESLAQAGIASFRMDFAGLGDSLGPQNRETTLTGLFEPRLGDITAALDKLAALGYRRFAIHGLCSGAYHAFHAALADPRISTLMLVNLPLFEEAPDADSEKAIRAALPWHYYARRLTHRKTWGKLFAGRYNLPAILQGQAKRLFRRRGAQSFPAAAMSRLSARGVRTMFQFGPEEIGYYAIQQHFGADARALTSLPNTTLNLAENFEHSLSLPQTQRQAAQAMLATLMPPRAA